MIFHLKCSLSHKLRVAVMNWGSCSHFFTLCPNSSAFLAMTEVPKWLVSRRTVSCYKSCVLFYAQSCSVRYDKLCVSLTPYDKTLCCICRPLYLKHCQGRWDFRLSHRNAICMAILNSFGTINWWDYSIQFKNKGFIEVIVVISC